MACAECERLEQKVAELEAAFADLAGLEFRADSRSRERIWEIVRDALKGEQQ